MQSYVIYIIYLSDFYEFTMRDMQVIRVEKFSGEQQIPRIVLFDSLSDEVKWKFIHELKKALDIKSQIP